MSWWVKDYIAVSEDETQQLCNIQTDAVSDLPAQDQTSTAGFIFVRGSKAEVLSTSGQYIMNSSGQWVLQKSGQEIEIGADDIVYDNASSGMTATNVQDAIDEIHSTDETQNSSISDLYTTKATVDDVFGKGILLPDETDLNNVQTPGSYYANNSGGATLWNMPVSKANFHLKLIVIQSSLNTFLQFFKQLNSTGDPYIYVRRRSNTGTWSPWYRFAGDVVTPPPDSTPPSLMSFNSPMALNLSRNDLNDIQEDGEEDV